MEEWYGDVRRGGGEAERRREGEGEEESELIACELLPSRWESNASLRTCARK